MAKPGKRKAVARPFDPQPVLRGELLELRPLRAEDHAALYAVAADPLLWEQHPARDRHRPEVFAAFFAEALASGGALVARDRHQDGRVIGSSRFAGHDASLCEVEIGWSFLARSHWGGRYNAEMKRLMLTHAFGFVERVVFCVGPDNRRSQRALEKIGAVQIEGRRPAAGRPDRVIYQITAAEFNGQRAPGGTFAVG